MQIDETTQEYPVNHITDANAIFEIANKIAQIPVSHTDYELTVASEIKKLIASEKHDCYARIANKLIDCSVGNGNDQVMEFAMGFNDIEILPKLTGHIEMATVDQLNALRYGYNKWKNTTSVR
jgi:hypothetical protein